FIEGGNDLDDGVEMAKMWDAMGVDYINVNCGLQETSYTNREPPSYQQGWKRGLATAVKAAVHCPVLAVNTIKKPEFAESLLESGVSDFVGLTRGHLADPYWTRKILDGREDEIRTCISCLNCMQTNVQGIQPTCTVNPRFGREYEFKCMKKNGNGRPVAVIGGGPAGMQAAIVLQQRGFRVTLFEKNSALGGQLELAHRPPNKEKILWLKQGMIAQVKHAGIDVRLNTEATVDAVRALAPCAVFVCCGSDPIRPQRIPGVNQANVYSVPQILSGAVTVENQNVCIVGSGLAGMETGVFLGEKGCKITILEMAPQIGAGLFPQVLDDVKNELAPYGTEIHAGTALKAINPDGTVTAATADGSEVRFAADAVVLAMGVKPKTDTVDAMRAAFDHVIAMGDAVKSGRALEAITDGYTKAWVFDTCEY
ncbi:MAG: FAD-dependent oxidoreductase, partial [Oscillospiraceae bacterium]|nr:FAD-dependent oxidoreductase [Oscillospiraceae bacterium]